MPFGSVPLGWPHRTIDWGPVGSAGERHGRPSSSFRNGREAGAPPGGAGDPKALARSPAAAWTWLCWSQLWGRMSGATVSAWSPRRAPGDKGEGHRSSLAGPGGQSRLGSPAPRCAAFVCPCPTSRRPLSTEAALLTAVSSPRRSCRPRGRAWLQPASQTPLRAPLLLAPPPWAPREDTAAARAASTAHGSSRGSVLFLLPSSPWNVCSEAHFLPEDEICVSGRAHNFLLAVG